MNKILSWVLPYAAPTNILDFHPSVRHALARYPHHREHPHNNKRKMSDEDAYARSLSRISIAQIVYAQAENMCEQNNTSGGKDAKPKTTRGTTNRLTSANNVSAQSTVVGSLADLLGIFIENIGKKSRLEAEHNGRRTSNLKDIIKSLKKNKIFTRDLAIYAKIESIEFPRSVPKFPVAPTKKRSKPSDDAQDCKLPRGGENWMPPLPPPHTYIISPGLVNDGIVKSENNSNRADLAAQRRSVSQSLARLSNPTELSGIVHNPYLQPPSIDSTDNRDDERAEPRDPPEPIVDNVVTESNRPIVRANLHESEAKRLRIERVMRESGGVTGVSAAAQQVAAAAANQTAQIQQNKTTPDGK